MAKDTPEYYLVDKRVLPEVFIKVMEVKQRINTGESASINDLVDYFSSQNEKIKKIVLFHVIFLIYSDTYLSESEKDTFNYIIEQFEIGSDEVEKIEELVKDFMDVNLRLKELIEL